VALEAVPVKFAVILPAAKLPEPSLATIVEAPFEALAVVDELGNGVVNVSELR
jgi:hypothetical protein